MTNAQHAQNVVQGGDTRTAKEVLRQYERLRQVQGRLVRAGILNPDASPADVIAELRRQVPHDLF